MSNDVSREKNGNLNDNTHSDHGLPAHGLQPQSQSTNNRMYFSISYLNMNLYVSMYFFDDT